MIDFIVSVLRSGVVLATPLLLAAQGELFVQKSGVSNLGLEGLLAMGAFLGFAVTSLSGDLWLGVLSAMIGGLVLNILFAFMAIKLGTNQTVSALSIFFLGTGLSYFLTRIIFGSINPSLEKKFLPLPIPFLSQIPIVGDIFFNQYIMVYIAVILALMAYVVLERTTTGLNIKAAGHNPRAADSLGINVHKLRYLSLMYEGLLTGLAGAFLSTSVVNMFLPGMSSGRGFIAVAVVALGRWSPIGTIIGAFIFGLFDSIGQSVSIVFPVIPYQFFLMLPYFATIVTLILASKWARRPEGIGKPFKSLIGEE